MGDVFVAKLNASGSALVYSTYLGGSSGEYGSDIALDVSGNAYVTGRTYSTDFPTAHALQPTNHCGTDAFVVKLNASGTALVYSTYLGGSSDDGGNGIAVDVYGNAYITGEIGSTDFPTANPLQPTYHGGNYEAFVAKLNASGTALVYSTYLGGSAYDCGNGIAVDVYGNAYVTGLTASTDFPTANPLQPTYHGGQYDAFVAKLNDSGTALVYSTYLGGSSDDHGQDIAVDVSGNAFVTGSTGSTDFPTANPLQPTNHGSGGGGDAFVAKLNASGTAFVYSTYLGGSFDDHGEDIAVDVSGNVYVTGTTTSIDFPTANPLQPTNHGNSDAFVAKIDFRSDTTTTLTSSSNPSVFGQSVTFTATVTGTGFDDGGTVTFSDGSTSLGTASFSGGKATLAATTNVINTLGTHTITAVYGGDSNFSGSSNSLTQVVQAVEIDTFLYSLAQVTLNYPDGSSETVTLAGPTTVRVIIPPSGAATDPNGNGLDQVSTEMTQLNLTGNSSMGPVTVTLDPNHPTLGQIEETVNNTPGTLDVGPFTATGTATSFFDVFFDITVNGQTLHRRTRLRTW